jgi:hypothetical protein
LFSLAYGILTLLLTAVAPISVSQRREANPNIMCQSCRMFINTYAHTPFGHLLNKVAVTKPTGACSLLACLHGILTFLRSVVPPISVSQRREANPNIIYQSCRMFIHIRTHTQLSSVLHLKNTDSRVPLCTTNPSQTSAHRLERIEKRQTVAILCTKVAECL